MSFYLGSTVGTYEIIRIGDRFNQTSCGSCLENYKSNDQVIKLACNHIFHESCFNTTTGYRKLLGVKASCLTCVRESNFDEDNLLNGQINFEQYKSLMQTMDEEIREGRNSAINQILRMPEKERRQAFEFERLHDPARMQERDASDRFDKCLKVMEHSFPFFLVTALTGLIGCLTLSYYSTGS